MTGDGGNDPLVAAVDAGWDAMLDCGHNGTECDRDARPTKETVAAVLRAALPVLADALDRHQYPVDEAYGPAYGGGHEDGVTAACDLLHEWSG